MPASRVNLTPPQHVCPVCACCDVHLCADASPSLPPRSRTPSSTSQLQYTDTTKLPWLRILPPEAHGTPHGYGSYIYNAAVGPYKSPNNTKHLQPIYEEPTKRSALTTDNEDWWFRSLALCARAFAYSPFASVVPIEAARDCVVAAAKLVPMANLKRGGVVPSLVEQRLDQVSTRKHRVPKLVYVCASAFVGLTLTHV